MTPKISVVIPVYNTQEYLGQCLDTVLLQKLQEIEVICVDDGSTDDSPSILQTYAMLDERLKIISQEHAGTGAARNRGLKEASGEYTIFLDSDDFFHPEMLEKMFEKAKADDSDIVMCGYLLFDNVRELDYHQLKIEDKYLKLSPFSPKDHSKDLFDIIFPSVWNKLFKTKFIKKHNLQFCDYSYASGIPFSYIAATLASKISLLEDCFIHYRKNRRGQLTDTNHDTETLTSLTELFNKLNQLDLKEFYKETYIDCFRVLLAKELQQRFPKEKRLFLNQLGQNLSPELAEFVWGNKNNQPKISIIIPAYNGADFLPQCLDSCLNQNLQEIEIICVDDGSTDNTLEIFKEYAQKDNRIKVIHQKNKGLPISRNNATKIAKGEYLQFVDADDWLVPDTCTCLYLYAKIHRLDMLSFLPKHFAESPRMQFDESGFNFEWLPKFFTPVFKWQDIFNFLPRVTVTAPLTIYRHQYLLDNNIHWINKKIVYEDTPFFLESLSKGARMGAFKIKLYQKRVHAEAISSNMDKNYPDYCWICRYTLQKLYKQMGYSPFFKSYLSIFMIKIHLNYIDFSDTVKKQMLPHLYRFCLYVLKRYHVPPKNEVLLLCQQYLKDKSIKKKLEFSLFNAFANWQESGYSFNPLKLSAKPFSISICGIKIKFFEKIYCKFKEKSLSMKK